MADMAQQGAARSAASSISIALCFAVAVLEGFDIQAIGVESVEQRLLDSIEAELSKSMSVIEGGQPTVGA